MPNGTHPPDNRDDQVSAGWDKKSWQTSYLLGVAVGAITPILVGVLVVLGASLGLIEP